MESHKICDVLCCGLQYKTWVNLRMHFLENHYPFEMIKYSESAEDFWKNPNDDKHFPWFVWCNNGAAVNFIDQLNQKKQLDSYIEYYKTKERDGMVELAPKLINLDEYIL